MLDQIPVPVEMVLSMKLGNRNILLWKRHFWMNLLAFDGFGGVLYFRFSLPSFSLTLSSSRICYS